MAGRERTLNYLTDAAYRPFLKFSCEKQKEDQRKKICQLASQYLQCLAHLVLHCFYGDAQPPGDLLVFQGFKAAHLENGAALLRQCLQCKRQLFFQLTKAQPAAGLFRVMMSSLVLRVQLMRGPYLLVLQVIQAFMIDGTIKISRNRLLNGYAPGLFPQPAKNDLHHFLRHFTVFHKSIGVAMQSPEVAFEQLLKGCFGLFVREYLLLRAIWLHPRCVKVYA